MTAAFCRGERSVALPGLGAGGSRSSMSMDAPELAAPGLARADLTAR